jgi:hypothetical protein
LIRFNVAIFAENLLKIQGSQDLRASSGNLQKNDREEKIFDPPKSLDTQGKIFRRELPGLGRI